MGEKRRSGGLGSPAGAVAMVLFVLALAWTVWRGLHHLNVPGDPAEERWVYQDFRDAVYYPVVALLDGHNPYDPKAYVENYPVGSWFPLYSPLTLLFHLPLGLLPFELAELAYFLFNLALLFVLVLLTFRFCGVQPSIPRLFGFVALLLFSRPGHWNALLGQVTLLVVLGVYMALFWSRIHPWLAGAGVAITMLKPTYGLPLLVLMICRSDWAAARAGIGLSALLGAGVLAVLIRVAGGVGAFVSSIEANLSTFEAHGTVQAWSSPFRVDAIALLSRLLGRPTSAAEEIGAAVLILAAAGLVIHLLRGEGSARAQRTSAGLACITVCLATYHLAYDLLVLILPAVLALFAHPPWPARRMERAAFLLAMAVLAANYAASGSAIDYFAMGGGAWVLITSINSLALTALFAVALAAAIRERAAALHSGAVARRSLGAAPARLGEHEPEESRIAT